MKQQIVRFSPDQNGRVMAVLMAASSLVIAVPMALLTGLMSPEGQGPSFWFFLLMPVMYLMLGYVMVAVGCLIYNLLARYVGGIEIELAPTQD